MLKTYLLALVIGLQTILGLNATVEHGYEDIESLGRPSATLSEPIPTANVARAEADYVQAIRGLGITMHPGTEFDKNSVENESDLRHCAGTVYKTLQVMPTETVAQLKHLTLYFSPTGRRGLGGGSTIILRCVNVTDEELVGVLIHELGHIQDTGVLTGQSRAGKSEFQDGHAPVYRDDPSLDFYRISFWDEKTIKRSAVRTDFVSGYASSDPFEDFAESYNYYLLHGNEFKRMAAGNTVLSMKYNFLKDRVFDGQEFMYDEDSSVTAKDERNYDATLVGFNLHNFLANT